MNAEPFSYSIRAADIPAGGKRLRLEADEESRARLAAALNIPAVEGLTAELEVRPVAAAAFSIRGELQASVVQTDVVSLEPVQQSVKEEIDVTLMPVEGFPLARRAGEEPADAAEADLFRNGRIDLGAIVTEHLALGLDPYPRAPNVKFAGHVEDDPAADPSPFAGLAALKPRPE